MFGPTLRGALVTGSFQICGASHNSASGTDPHNRTDTLAGPSKRGPNMKSSNHGGDPSLEEFP